MTLRTWTRATLHEIVTQVLDPFPWARIQIVGEQIEVPEKHHFALSLILHELATNAVKYGAFSCDEGRVLLSWAAAAGKLTLEWKEQNGPAFRTPTRHGFGDRLIHALARSLGGEIRPLYDPSGFVCNLVISV